MTLGTTLTVGGGDATFAGISGTGNPTKTGTGSLNLARTNSYTGATAINIGRLAMAFASG